MDVANRMIPAVFTALYCPVTSQPQKDDVEYPNGNWCSSVVGYQAQSFVQNMNFRCAAFVPVGKGVLLLWGIRPSRSSRT